MPSARRSASLSRLAPWLVLAVLILVADQATKHVIAGSLQYAERRTVLAGFFDLTLAYNTGAAFSFLAGAGGWQRWMFIGLGTVATLVILVLLARHGNQKVFALALTLIAAGAVGNVVDRVLYGHVIDFLLFYWRDWYFPAFNVADSAIVGGAILLVLDEYLRVRRGKP